MTLGNLLKYDQEEQFGKVLVFVRDGSGVGLLRQLGQQRKHGGDFGRDRGRSGQVVTNRTEASLVSGPSQSDLLTLRADVVGRALVGITGLIARSDLDVGLLAGRSIGTSEATLSEICVGNMIRAELVK